MTPDRFWARVDKSGDCWTWSGLKKGNGYGRVWWDGRGTTAHRAAWMIANGPIPPGLCVLHRCDNPPCCNPAHLFAGTQQQNIADKVAKGRHRYELSLLEIAEIREQIDSGLSDTEIAAAFGVARNTIGNYRRRCTTADAPGLQ